MLKQETNLFLSYIAVQDFKSRFNIFDVDLSTLGLKVTAPLLISQVVEIRERARGAMMHSFFIKYRNSTHIFCFHPMGQNLFTRQHQAAKVAGK